MVTEFLLVIGIDASCAASLVESELCIGEWLLGGRMVTGWSNDYWVVKWLLLSLMDTGSSDDLPGVKLAPGCIMMTA